MKRIHFASMLLTCALSGGALFALAAPTSGAAPTSKAVPSIQGRPSAQSARGAHGRIAQLSCQPRKPRGLRVTVRGRFVVTDSDDGVQDNDVEVYGYVDFNGQRTWTRRKKAAVTRADQSIFYTAERTFDVMDNDPSTWKLKVTGYMNDYDKGSDDDAMWNPRRQTRQFDMSDAYKKAVRSGGMEVYTWKGDRDSESADLIIQFTKIDLIY